MEPTDALRSIEVALRLAIREVLGETGWLDASGAPEKARLEERRSEEKKRRDGAIISGNLIDYTETYHLTTMIEKNWQQFQIVFKDKGRTLAFFGVIEDVRNSIAHSRDLVPFERDLISGIAGQFRNQVSLFRSSRTESSRYYPLIESVKDNFGAEAQSEWNGLHIGARLEVGDSLTFSGTAFNARGRAVTWSVLPQAGASVGVGPVADKAVGDSVVLRYTVQEADVNEWFLIHIRIAADSKFHPNMEDYRLGPHDDVRIFTYAVNPPDEA